MPTWAAASNVEARLSYSTAFSVSTRPTLVDVNQWIDEAEGQIRGVLRAHKLPTTITDTDATNIIIAWVCDYVVGNVLKAWGRQNGTSDLDEGEALLDQWRDHLDQLRRKSIQLGSELDASGAVADARQKARAYVTDNSDSKTIAGGDFDAVITSSEVF